MDQLQDKDEVCVCVGVVGREGWGLQTLFYT